MKISSEKSQPKNRETKSELRTWIEVDTKAIEYNIQLAKKSLPTETKIMSIIKSNAYGHGLVDFASCITKSGAEWLGVDSIVEAFTLRAEGIKTPILVMGYSLPSRFSEAAEQSISITVSSFTTLQEVLVSPSRNRLKLHIKIDTGLHRQGFLPHEVPSLLETLKKNKSELVVEGLYTHLADAKRIQGEEYSKIQKKIFDDIVVDFVAAGFSPITHVSASPALIRFGAEGEHLVRLGAFLYGIFPSDELEAHYENHTPIKPALSWKTIVTELKKIPAGSSVGYNRSEFVDRETLLGVCPVGYWHGYTGTLSSKGIVMVQGVDGKKSPAKVLGRVTMDMITIDCTDCPGVKVGDEVILIDAQKESQASAVRIAKLAGVSVHELITRLNSRIKRIYMM
jgi:alanine racemase